MDVKFKFSYDCNDLKLTHNGDFSFMVSSVDEMLLSDVPSDISVEAGETTFALHKFPLVSRSGRIRKQLAESKDATKVHLQDMPGGAEAFELAAKFCYGVNLEITASNVAMLRCAASYLQMNHHYSDTSLETRTETYLNEIVIHNLPDSVTVLHSCDNLLPFAEDLKITSRCIEGITSAACKEQLKTGLSRLHYTETQQQQEQQSKSSVDSWWGKELAVLNIHMFQRVVTAMKFKGLSQDIISGALMHYARNSLQGYTNNINNMNRPKFKFPGSAPPTVEEREMRSVVETVVSLLPPQNKSIPVSFVSWLLRAAIMLNSTASCRTELEKRFAGRLDEAGVDDLLIPSYKDDGHTLYDTDEVLRIFTIFLQFSEEADEDYENGGDHMGDIMGREGLASYESDGMGSPNHKHDENGGGIQVSKLMDSYLAEISPDSNLSVSRFIALAEAVPDRSRLVDDGLYRAIDIFLKAHPAIKDVERNKLCKLLDCQKLSHEACTHAAQNERLPVQLAVQVLYFEQLRLRTAMHGGDHHHHHHHQRLSSGIPSAAISPRDNYASVRRENRELKLEVARMRMRLTDLEKDHNSMKQELVKSTPTHKFLHSFSKKLSKLNSLFRSKDNPNNPLFFTNNNSSHLMSRRRRHSIS